jgi:hypothetical protein
MLAQAFKSAADLGITEPQRDALCKTLVLLETGKLKHEAGRCHTLSTSEEHRKFSGRFNMSEWAAEHDCGTVCCIGGTAELVGNTSFGMWEFGSNEQLKRLFAPPRPIRCGDWTKITPSQAATALRSYLTTGDAKWHEAVS